MTSDIIRLFAVNAAVIFVLALVLWRVAVKINDPSFIDVCWGLGFVVVAWTSFALTNDGPHRKAVLAIVTTIWGLRLAGYLFWRWRKNGPDTRYVAMLKRADNPSMFMLTRVFLMQAALLLIVSLPLQLGQVYPQAHNLRAVHLAGLALCALGILFESTADAQLVAFKANDANKGQVLDTGLWRFTRHPNYFGDFCVWWGLFVIALTNRVTLLAIVSPLLMSFLLMRWSGVGPLERQMKKRKPGYDNYITRTSGFFPLPPRGTKTRTTA